MDYTNPAYWSAAVNAGLCRLLVLREVCRKPGHGYALVHRIASRTRWVCTPTEATIYPTLAELTQSGCLQVTDCPVGRRMRKVYAATPEGRRACVLGTRAWRAGLQALCGAPSKTQSIRPSRGGRVIDI